MDYNFKFKPKGTVFLPEYFEGFLAPRLGRTPFKVIDDPNIIAKKNQMRQALRDEHTRRIYNPYRWASGIGGVAFDPAMIRYQAMSRQGWRYYQTGPKMVFSGLMLFCIFPFTVYWIAEEIYAKNEIKLRTGQIAYKDRNNKWAY